MARTRHAFVGLNETPPEPLRGFPQGGRRPLLRQPLLGRPLLGQPLLGQPLLGQPSLAVPSISTRRFQALWAALNQ